MGIKIPDSAFDFYVALDPTRRYEQVAAHFDASKRGIVKKAGAERWQERLAEIDRQVQDRNDNRLVNEIDDMRTRHLKTVRAMLGRAIKGLREFPITTGMDAIRAADMTIKLERLILGEASERTEVSVEETMKREMQRWLVPKDVGGDEGSGVGGEGASDAGEQLGGEVI